MMHNTWFEPAGRSHSRRSYSSHVRQMVLESVGDGHVRRRVRRGLGRGFRSHPLLGLVLVVAAVSAFAVAIMLLIALALAGAVAALVAIGGYRLARALVRPARPTQSLGAAIRIDAGGALQQYLYAVEEFSDLTDRALLVPIDRTAHGRPVSSDAAAARRLARMAERLTHDWSGSNDVRVCLVELQGAAETLARYFVDLQRGGSRAPSVAELRWQREELIERRDGLIARLRETDFRTGQRPLAGSPS